MPASASRTLTRPSGLTLRPGSPGRSLRRRRLIPALPIDLQRALPRGLQRNNGRLGNGIDVERQPVAKVGGLPAIASVVAGGGVTFARTRNNELYAWGL